MQMMSISVRLERSSFEKLERISFDTGRSMSQVMRRLVDLAEETGAADIRLASETGKDHAA